MQVAWVGLDHEDHTWEPVEVIFKYVPKFLVRNLKQMRLPKRAKNALRQRYGMKSECHMKIRGGFYCDQCIYGFILDVLEHGFKELMQRAFSLFPSGELLKSVTVEFRFALTIILQ